MARVIVAGRGHAFGCVVALFVFVLCGLAGLGRAQSPRVGIVGSGITGASAARFVREALPKALIDVFERSAVVGGRCLTAELMNGAVVLDVGATAISSQNEYLVGLVDEFGMKRAANDDDRKRLSLLGIWDGADFRLLAGEAPAVLAVAMAQRYGARSVATVEAAVEVTVRKLGALYERQRHNVSFESPEAMLRAVGLYDATQRTAYEYFDRLGVDETFVREVVDGASRDNYNQPGTLNALADLVSLAGAGFGGATSNASSGGGAVFTLAGGTAQLPAALLKAARAKVHLGEAVDAIEALFEGGYTIRTASRTADYDFVIVATPLEFSPSLKLPDDILALVDHHHLSITGGGGGGGGGGVSSRAYQPTYVTFAAGTLSSDVFGRASPALDTILTVETPDVPFSCCGAHARLPSGATVYKFMSRTPLDDAAVTGLFEDDDDDEEPVILLRHGWNATGAYTNLAPNKNWPPFLLRAGLYYPPAMESPVSCMETQIIAAKNAALLLKRDFLVQQRASAAPRPPTVA